MHRLPRQVIGKRDDPRPRLGGRLVQPRAVQRVGDVRNQFRHNRSAIAQIPLQDPVQAGMAEAVERPADPPGHLAKPCDRGRRQVTRILQCPAWQVSQQPHVCGSRHQSGNGGALLAGNVWHWNGDAQRRLGLGDPVGRQVLGFDFGRVKRRIGDLQHPNDFTVG